MPYLLDTNLCIRYLRGQTPLVTQRLAAQPAGEVRLCSVVVAELYYGAARSNRPAAERSKVDAFVQLFTSLPFDDAAADAHAEIRIALEAKGMPIGPHDLMIAAIARSANLTLVTHNTAEFGRVPGLVIEDWEVP